MKSATRSDSSPFLWRSSSERVSADRRDRKTGIRYVRRLPRAHLSEPAFLMVMLLVKALRQGPIFYGHRRIGHNGQEFRCLKFRTMVTNGDKVLQEYLRNNPKAMEEWRATRKLQDDPRVTAVGAVLRKLSLDELPQLFNIIRGEMSVVGPRPVVRDELEMYENAAVYYPQSPPWSDGPLADQRTQ